MSVTSEEVNFLVYRYLQESGFTHAAFALSYEGMVGRSNINGALVPPGALVTMLQKGLQFQEIEAHLTADGSEAQCGEPFSLVTPHVCKGRNVGLENITKASADGAAEPVAEARTVSRQDVSVLVGHSSEVFSCAWNPTVPVLASGSADATARLWTVPAVPSSRDVVADPPVVLAHRSDAAARDVTALDFSADGARLATGSTDGRVRVFATSGALQQTLEQHRAPVFAVRWNRKGDSLLSASADRSVVIWDPATGAVKQSFEFHSAPVLDVAWRNDTTFASCSTDGTVIVAQLGALKPIKSWQGHESEVNAVRWDPVGHLAATASDDMTVKVWDVEKDEPVFDFTDHQREVYTLAWSNTGPGTPNDKLPLVLATASFDATVRVYDVTLGICLFTLSAPITGPVYTVDFSPDGAYMLTGSFDHTLCTWSARDGSLVSSYRSGGGVLDAKFNPRGDKIAACLSDNTLVVMDFVRPQSG